jgi:hypothetical protein
MISDLLLLNIKLKHESTKMALVALSTLKFLMTREGRVIYHYLKGISILYLAVG